MSAQDIVFTVDSGSGSHEPDGATEVPVTTFPAGGPSTISSSDYLLITATNFGSDTLESVGLWIALATIIGEDDIRTTRSTESDLLDVIRIGDDALEDHGPLTLEHGDPLPGDYVQGGIWVQPAGTTWYRVCSLRGNSLANRIGTETLAPAATTAWKVLLEPPAGAVAARYFFDIMVENVDTE